MQYDERSAEIVLAPASAQGRFRRFAGRRYDVVFSTDEIEALLLFRGCHFISKTDYHKAISEEVIEMLKHHHLITVYEKHNAYELSQPGIVILNEKIHLTPPYKRPCYTDTYIARRLRVSAFVLTAYSAGLFVLTSEESDLQKNATLYLTSLSRSTAQNPWGSSRVAVLVHLGNIMCGVYVIYRNVGLLALNDEMKALTNCASRFSGVTPAVILTGKSYDVILAEITAPAKGKKTKKETYADLFGQSPYPVFLIPCNAVGSQQLIMMTKPDYRKQMTKIALGDAIAPPPHYHPEWDGLLDGVPVVMAADMDLRRIDAAAESAKASGHAPIILICLKGQQSLLRERYKATGLAQKVFTFRADNPEYREAIKLYTPSGDLYTTAKGEWIRVPSGKTRRTNRRTSEKQDRQLAHPP